MNDKRWCAIKFHELAHICRFMRHNHTLGCMGCRDGRNTSGICSVKKCPTVELEVSMRGALYEVKPR